jgi:short subunit dehydrogenase-like uncharacterized protein
MLYGANGYTGRLVARLAVARGERPVLAGRDAAAVAALAGELGLDHRVFGLDDPVRLREGLTDIAAVAHCAGPFNGTAAPMVRGCLAVGAHYLDINGEIAVFEHVFANSERAVDAGVVLLPGAGFDVVPTDCLAALLHAELPSATSLELAFIAGGGISPGTAKTSLEGLRYGGRARIDGRLRAVPLGWKRRAVPFPSGSHRVVSVPWGDVASAFRSTGIPNIVTYARLPRLGAPGRASQQAVRLVTRIPPARRLLANAVERATPGPDRARRASSHSEVWGQVRDASGRTATATLTAPNPYDLTADSLLRAVNRLLAEPATVAPGAHTPSTAFGAEFVTDLDGTELFGPYAD